MSKVLLPHIGFAEALAQAQARLAALPDGQGETWVLPDAPVELAEGPALGADGRWLTIEGAGARSGIVLGGAAALAVSGTRVVLTGFAVDAAECSAPVVLAAAASTVLRAEDMIVTGGALSGGGLTGLGLTAPDIHAARLHIRDIRPGGGDAVGLALGGVGKARLQDIRIDGLSGAAVTGIESPRVSKLSGDTILIEGLTATASATGLRAEAGDAILDRVTVAGLLAAGQALGAEIAARGEATLRDATLSDLRGHGLAGRDIADPEGDGARGVRLSGTSGSLRRVAVEGLAALTGRPVGLRFPPGFDSAELSIARAIDGADLVAALAEAQADLADAPEGSLNDWQLPGGIHVIDAPVALGAAGRGLRLRGAPQDTTLRFRDGGGPIAGDLDALTLSGSRVDIAALTVDARASGALRGLVVTATETAELADIDLVDGRGGTIPALCDVGAPEVSLNGIALRDSRATAGDATGLRLRADTGSVISVQADTLRASGRLTGLDLQATRVLHLSACRVRNLSADAVTGVVARVSGPGDGALSAIDLRLERLAGANAGGDGVGAAFLCDGDVELRAILVDDLRAARAFGAVVAATGPIDWLAAEVSDIRGLAGGASGIRVVAAPMPARDDGRPGIALHDMVVRAVRGAATTGQGLPADSWRALAPDLADRLIATGLAALPGAADAGHAEEIVGLAITAPIPDATGWLDTDDPASVILESGVFRRISGTILQADCALRDMGITYCEAWTGVDAAWIDGERVLIANTTWHRMHRGIAAVQSDVTVVNSLITQVANGPGLSIGPGGRIGGGASFATLGSAPLVPEPEPLPYRDPGPASDVPPSVVAGDLAPQAAIDLGLVEDTLHGLARPVPGQPLEMLVFMGAVPPRSGACCSFVDPDPVLGAAPTEPMEPSPFLNYQARDARAFLQVMRDRAAVVMPDWTSRGPADITTMLLELMASELDLRAYRQEEAVANGYLSTATLRRALEDHARLVDHPVDKGASAVAMLEFARRDWTALGLAEEDTVTIPAGTLAVNADADDIALVFATEAALVVDPDLAVLRLVRGSGIGVGDLSAEIAGDFADRLAGRWLVISGKESDGAPLEPHVVRVVSATQSADSTLITWDPRRPASAEYTSDTCEIRANVVPAHHGVPLAARPDDPLAPDPLSGWRDAMVIDLAPRQGRLRDVTLPSGPVFRPRDGWPMPGAAPEYRAPALRAWLDGVELRLTDDLSDDLGSAPVMALRTDHEGAAALTLANAQDGGVLELACSVGLGALGNVGPHALRRILHFGTDPAFDAILPARADRLEILLREISVTNLLRATGGRDPEGLESIRAGAPLAHRQALSAVAPQDYSRLLEGLDTVHAARATALDRGLTRMIRVTALMTDEDTLARPDLGPAREAERLRRWAVARGALDDIRLMGFDVELLPPDFVPLDIDLSVDVADWASADQVRRGIDAALRDDGGLFDPDSRGLGRDVTPHAIKQAVLSVPGAEAVRLLRLRRLAPFAEDFARAAQMPIGDTEVAILKRPYGTPDGVLTVETCGGVP